MSRERFCFGHSTLVVEDDGSCDRSAFVALEVTPKEEWQTRRADKVVVELSASFRDGKETSVMWVNTYVFVVSKGYDLGDDSTVVSRLRNLFDEGFDKRPHPVVLVDGREVIVRVGVRGFCTVRQPLQIRFRVGDSHFTRKDERVLVCAVGYVQGVGKAEIWLTGSCHYGSENVNDEIGILNDKQKICEGGAKLVEY